MFYAIGCSLYSFTAISYYLMLNGKMITFTSRLTANQQQHQKIKMIRVIRDQKDACYACSHCKCSVLCRVVFSYHNNAYLLASVLYGLISHFNSSRPIAKTTRCESLLYKRIGCISQEGQVGFQFAFKTKANFCNLCHFCFDLA